MPIKYKIDVVSALKTAGYSSYRIRKEKIFGENSLQCLRERKLVSWEVLTKICELLDFQPGDILEYVKEKNESEQNNEQSVK